MVTTVSMCEGAEKYDYVWEFEKFIFSAWSPDLGNRLGVTTSQVGEIQQELRFGHILPPSW